MFEKFKTLPSISGLGLTRLMATSDNYTLLSEAWEKWRKETGHKLKGKYQKLVELSNQAVKQLGS